MSSEKPKSALLTEKLDFEAVDAPSSGDADFDFEHLFDTPLVQPESPLTNVVEQENVISALVKPVIGPKHPDTNGTRNDRLSDKKKAKPGAKAKNDQFGRYAAVFALIGFLILFLSVFYVRSNNDNSVASYVVLPQTVANINGQMLRIQVTIQVAPSDQDWLQENKKILSNLFQIEVAKIDPDDLHTEAGINNVREFLKTQLNNAMKTDKIESVLINELLTQNKE